MSPAHVRVAARFQTAGRNAAGRCPQTRYRLRDVAREEKTQDRAKQTNAEQTKIGMRADSFRDRHDQSWRLLEGENVSATGWALNQSHRDSLSRIDRGEILLRTANQGLFGFRHLEN